MNHREAGGIGRIFATLMAVILIIALAGAVGYLLSDINHRRYRLHAAAGRLLIERGRFLPFGFEPFVPKAATLAEAYAPVTLPAHKKDNPPAPEIFDDRADVDRALFAMLAGWARQGMALNDGAALRSAASYIERSQLLPGLSEQQRVDLKTLRADLAYRTGKTLLTEMVDTLRQAYREFELSERLGPSRPTDAQGWMQDIEEKIQSYGGQPIEKAESADAKEDEPKNGVKLQNAPKGASEGLRMPKTHKTVSEAKPQKWRL